MMDKEIKGKIYIDFGADNFCYIYSRNGRRINLTEWMKKFNGKKVIIKVQVKENEK